jgi:2-polyprenyl-3-methyl-5-hydroxy-6-metoxy-1,4-benzoquinol methylase
MKRSDADKILQSNKEVHRLEAEIYDSIHPELFGPWEQRRIARDLDFIAPHLADRPEPCVLDIGCGTGNLTLKFLKRGYRVKAVDLSPEMLHRLCSKVSPPDAERLEVVEGDAEEILSDTEAHETYDIIACSSVLHHLPDYRSVLARALCQLRPGGVLYVCHEPLPRMRTGSHTGASALLAKVVRQVDVLYILARKLLVYAIHSLTTQKPFRRIDHSWSDYHLRTGIDPQEILVELQSLGARTLRFETYRSYHSSLISRLDSYFPLSAPSHFRFIVQQVKSDQAIWERTR